MFRLGDVTVSTANPNLDGTGTLGTVYTAGPAGALILRIDIQASVTTTDGMIRLFVNDGTNTRLWVERVVSPQIVAADVKAFADSYTPSPPLPLEPGWSLLASTNQAESFNVAAYGTDS